MTNLLEKTNLKTISVIENRPLIIFDVGCNIDQSVLTDFTQNCLDYCSNVKIIGIEPVHYKAYENKYKIDDRVVLIKNALSFSSENRIFFDTKIHGCPGLSSFVERPMFKDWGDGVEKKSVECTTIDEICEKQNIKNIDYLKIDTEGGELDVLRGSTRMLVEKKVKYIQFECGGCAIEAGYGLHDIQYFLEKYGYQIIDRCGEDYLAILHTKSQ